jgi:hypothetical protein
MTKLRHVVLQMQGLVDTIALKEDDIKEKQQVSLE